MAQNLANFWRKIPQRVDMLTVVSPHSEEAEVYTFNPTLEKIREKNLDAFYKPQINAAPAIITTNEWIGWIIAPATQEQIRQNRLAEARTKIIDALSGIVKLWKLSTKAWQEYAKTLIDLYNKVK